ncbi:MAG: ParB/RepB/Spo0J family partition protein [Chthoniobacteraceae bacterium]
MVKPALGKGLSALINPRVASPTPRAEDGERIQMVSLDQIIPSPWQPRSEFRDENLQELAESIREKGIVQPLIVRVSGEKLELVAGERRWRAAQRAGLKQAPVIVRQASDQDVLELALIENLQREDLNAIEEARAFDRLATEFHLKQEDIAQKVGKSRAAVANSMRLLDLHSQVQTWIVQERLSVGHAKVLLGAKSHDDQLALAEESLRRGLTVRGVERLVADHFAGNGSRKPKRGAASSPQLEPAIAHLQNRLRQHLGTQVTMHHGEKKGRIEIEYYGNDDLHRLLKLIGLPDEE